MSKLHLVFGGRVKDPRGIDFDLGSIDLVGVYDSYAEAEDAWVLRDDPEQPADASTLGEVLVNDHVLRESEAGRELQRLTDTR